MINWIKTVWIEILTWYCSKRYPDCFVVPLRTKRGRTYVGYAFAPVSHDEDHLFIVHVLGFNEITILKAYADHTVSDNGRGILKWVETDTNSTNLKEIKSNRAAHIFNNKGPSRCHTTQESDRL